MLKNTTRCLAEYEENRALQSTRFAETAERYLANPELAKSYLEEARSHIELAETLHSLADANS